jgi:hypothetical protein
VAFTGAAFFTDAFAFTGFCIAAVGFILVFISRSRDVRHARRERLPGWIS